MYTHMLLGEYFTIIYRNLRRVIHGIFILFVIENSIIIEKLYEEKEYEEMLKIFVVST